MLQILTEKQVEIINIYKIQYDSHFKNFMFSFGNIMRAMSKISDLSMMVLN